MKKQIIIAIAVFTIFLHMESCDKLFSEDKLTLQRVDYYGNELRIDGYFYNTVQNYEEEFLNIHFLYSNGIVRYGGGGFSSFEDVEDAIINSRIVDGRSRTDWGVFQVSSNVIKFERWYPPSGGGAPAYVREGTIINDKSFHITLSYRSNGTERREKDEVYHFRQFSPKPDSTNVFIK